MSERENRMNAVAGIINSRKVKTQDELLQALENQGIFVTQATLSRDMKELGAVKMTDARDGFYYAIPSSRGVVRNSNMNVDRIDFSGQLCVIHSKPGFASVIASMIDEAAISGVMGTVAGDDTVVVALRQGEEAATAPAKIRTLFDFSEISVRVAQESDSVFAQEICDEIFISSQERKTGIARRTPEYIIEKMKAGKAVIAISEEGEFAGFSYIESWGGKSFVANSGLIVAHKFRGRGIARRIKEQTFILSRKLFPEAKIFSITTGAAVMKMNYEFGFRPVPFTELTNDPEFWKGCEGCRHFDILKSHDYKMCICTGLLYDPDEHLSIHHPYDK